MASPSQNKELPWSNQEVQPLAGPSGNDTADDAREDEIIVPKPEPHEAKVDPGKQKIVRMVYINDEQTTLIVSA